MEIQSDDKLVEAHSDHPVAATGVEGKLPTFLDLESIHQLIYKHVHDALGTVCSEKTLSREVWVGTFEAAQALAALNLDHFNRENLFLRDANTRLHEAVDLVGDELTRIRAMTLQECAQIAHNVEDEVTADSSMENYQFEEGYGQAADKIKRQIEALDHTDVGEPLEANRRLAAEVIRLSKQHAQRQGERT